ncbi:MAG: 30S ribosomal protein S6 [Elusimicrobia bacterium RIFCSPLOWO2_01_FULL_54_10]|nr:MAG: 30S ribosomal protein S6 [Elusimicrobia bacterium RIFCSPLOWO2_01_FULL_54_10]
MYESIFICPGELADDKVQAALDKTKAVISRGDGKIMTAELWGRRRLAYPIERSREGHYAYMIFSGPSQIPGVLDRHYQVSDSILRGLTVKIDPRHLDKIKPSLKALSEEGAAVAAPAAEGVPAAPAAQESSPQAPA